MIWIQNQWTSSDDNATSYQNQWASSIDRVSPVKPSELRQMTGSHRSIQWASSIDKVSPVKSSELRRMTRSHHSIQWVSSVDKSQKKLPPKPGYQAKTCLLVFASFSIHWNRQKGAAVDTSFRPGLKKILIKLLLLLLLYFLLFYYYYYYCLCIV